MATDELSDLRARVERLEAEVARMRGPLGQDVPVRVLPEPPPVARPVPQSHSGPTSPAMGQGRLGHVSPATMEPSAPHVDSEIKFGSQVLPRAGIVLVLIGVLTLVAKAIERGWITIGVQFVGELLLCAALVVIGIWKIREREDFGQVLVGGGSCGLYLSLAGGHVYKDLYEGETLVALFLALSFSNFAFSWWRSSKSFWMIGFVGGLVAAGLPSDESNFAASLVLAALIVVPATLLAASQRWMKALAGLWLVSGLFVLIVARESVASAQMSVPAGLAVLGSFSLVPVAAYAWRFVASALDSKGAFLIAAGVVTSLGMLVVGRDAAPLPHALAIGLLSLALGAVAYPVRQRVEARALVVSALVSATAVAPVAFDPFVGSLTYAGLSLLASLIAFKSTGSLSRASVYFASALFALSGIAYAVAMGGDPLAIKSESALLAAMTLALLAVCGVASRLENQGEIPVSIAALLLFPIVSRGSFLSAGHPDSFYFLLVGQGVYGLLLAVLAWRSRWRLPAVLALAFAFLTAFTYWTDMEWSYPSVESGRQLGLMLLLTATLVPAVLGTAGKKSERDTAAVFGALLGWFLLSRAMFLVLTLPSIGMQREAALSVSWVLYGGLVIVLGFLLELKPLRIVSFVVFGVTIAKVLMVDLSEVDALIRVLVLVVLGAILIAGGYIYVRRRDDATSA